MLLLAPAGGKLRKADAGAVVSEPESLKVPPNRIIRFLELSFFLMITKCHLEVCRHGANVIWWEKNIPVQQTGKIPQIKNFPLGKDNSVGLGII